MNKLPPLTVNIFQETLGPKIPLDMIESGVDEFRETTEGVRIGQVGERRHIYYAGENYVTADRYIPESIGADLGILVTRRALVYSEDIDENNHRVISSKEKDLEIVGVAINGKSLKLPKLALVSVGENPYDMSVASTTTHELGHLVNVKSYGDTFDLEDHCLNESCVMNRVVTDENAIRYAFCADCEPQVVEHTTILRLLKAGQPVSIQQRAKLLERNAL